MKIELTRGRPALISVEDKKNKFAIPVTLQIKDGEDVIFETSDKIIYREGQDLAETLTPTHARLQKKISKFEAEKALDDKAAVDNAVDTLKSRITTNLGD